MLRMYKCAARVHYEYLNPAFGHLIAFKPR